MSGVSYSSFFIVHLPSDFLLIFQDSAQMLLLERTFPNIAPVTVFPFLEPLGSSTPGVTALVMQDAL